MMRALRSPGRARRWLSSLLLLPWPGACASSSKYAPEWQEDEIEAPSDRLLWEVTVFALEKERFPLGAQIDPVTLTAVSGWRNSLQPFRGKGRRTRAEVRYEPLGPGRYKVRVRVEQEVNMDIVRPLDLTYAKWEEAPDDPQAAAVILQRVRSWIGPQLELKSSGPPRPPGS